MNKCVIRVGTYYYSGNGLVGECKLTRTLDKAKVFDCVTESTAIAMMTEKLGGVVEPLTLKAGNTGAWDEMMDDNSWFAKHIPYILNCTGPTNEMLRWYRSWMAQHEDGYDVSKFVGVPCTLHISAFETRREFHSQQQFVCAFMLVTSGKLTKEQELIWKECPYGVLLIDHRRILVPDIKVLPINLSFPETASAVSRGGGKVKNTEERREVVKRYMMEVAIATEDRGCTDEMKPMNLFGAT